MMTLPRDTRWQAMMPNGKLGESRVPELRSFRERVADETLERLEKMIATYPVPAIVMALSAGVLVGWWIKRS